MPRTVFKLHNKMASLPPTHPCQLLGAGKQPQSWLTYLAAAANGSWTRVDETVVTPAPGILGAGVPVELTGAPLLLLLHLSCPTGVRLIVSKAL